eukprot:gene1147-3711_t
MLYRMTLGRFYSPESVAKSSEARLSSMSTKVEGYVSEASKLKERMTLVVK